MENIDLNKVIQPALAITNRILKQKGLGDSNLLKKTSIDYTAGKLTISMPSYAEYVDRGRRAGRMPPVSAILRWIRQDNIAVPSQYTQEQFAFAVAKSVARKGTKGKFFLEQLADNIQELVFDYLDKQITQKLKQI